MKGPLEHARMLVRKAENDLHAAKTVLPTLVALDTVCFHCQQAVEKCLKAMLALRDVEFPHTHDLRILCDLAAPLVPGVAEFRSRIHALLRYAVEVRYEDEDDPKVDHAQKALAVAEDIRQFTVDLLASPARMPAREDTTDDQ